jgi:hypothetical protein
MSEEPEDLLMKRLMIKEKEVSDYKNAVQLYRNALEFLMGFVDNVVESLPEPEVMRDASDYMEYPLYKEYLVECANLFEYYKMNILAVKENMK